MARNNNERINIEIAKYLGYIERNGEMEATKIGAPFGRRVAPKDLDFHTNWNSIMIVIKQMYGPNGPVQVYNFLLASQGVAYKPTDLIDKYLHEGNLRKLRNVVGEIVRLHNLGLLKPANLHEADIEIRYGIDWEDQMYGTDSAG